MRLERGWIITGPIFSAYIKRLRGGMEIPSVLFRIITDEEAG